MKEVEIKPIYLMRDYDLGLLINLIIYWVNIVLLNKL